MTETKQTTEISCEVFHSGHLDAAKLFAEKITHVLSNTKENDFKNGLEKHGVDSTYGTIIEQLVLKLEEQTITIQLSQPK